MLAEHRITFDQAGGGGEFGVPFLIATVSPFGKVLTVDGMSAEAAVDDGFDFRQIIEPFQYLCSRVVEVEVEVDSCPDAFGELSDFAISFHV